MNLPGKVNLNLRHRGKPATKNIIFYEDAFYLLSFKYPDVEDMSSFAESEVMKMNYIGSVADILCPDLSMQEDFISEDGESSIAENMDEDDFQTLVEEMQKSEIPLTDSTQFHGWEQLTPPLSSPSCPTTLNLPQSEIPTLNDAESQPGKVISDLSDAPETSMDKHEDLGPEKIITSESAKCPIATVSDPPLGRTRQATKKLYAMPKKEMNVMPKEIPSRRTRSASCEQTFPKKVSTTPKADVAKIRLSSFGGRGFCGIEDIVLYKDQYKEEYGKLITISICYLI